MNKIKEYAIEHVGEILTYTCIACAGCCGFVIGWLFGFEAGGRR